MFKNWRSKVRCLTHVTIGSFFFALGIDAFVIPHNLVGGGISGIALMLFYITGLSVGTLNLLLNLPIIYASYRWLGSWNTVVTILGTAICSFAINALSFMSTYGWTHNPIVGAILGGIFCGLGLGIVYRGGGNTGGLDPIAMIIRRRWGLQMGSIVFGINCVILIAAAIVVNVESSAITLISLYISAVVTNKVVIGFNQRKAVFIISYHTDKICDLIINQLARGATILHGEGAYTHQDKQVILAVVGLMQVGKLKAAIEEVDPGAFLLIMDAAEVIGLGFTRAMPRIPLTAQQILEAQQASVSPISSDGSSLETIKPGKVESTESGETEHNH